MTDNSPNSISEAQIKALLASSPPRASEILNRVFADDNGESIDRFIMKRAMASFTDNGDGTFTWNRPARTLGG